MKPGSLSLLEPSGPVQACNGIALSLTVNNRGIVMGGEFSWKSHEERPNKRSLNFFVVSVVHEKRRSSDGRTSLVVTVERNKTDSLFCGNSWGLSTLKTTTDLCRCHFTIVRTNPVFLSLHIPPQNVTEICRGEDVRYPLFTMTQHSVSGPCGHLVHHSRRQTQLQILPVPLTVRTLSRFPCFRY